MMKNRAVMLALGVLAGATILMVLVVMPQLRHDTRPLGDAINEAGKTVKSTITGNQAKAPAVASTEAPATPLGDASALTPQAAEQSPSIQQLSTLQKAATSSLQDLKTLFSATPAPSAQALDLPKTKAITSLSAVLHFPSPSNASAAVANIVDRAHQAAAQALDIVKGLPNDASAAAAALDRAISLLDSSTADQPDEAAAAKPSFDVLRVEPDGSTVIAGRAAPNARLDVLDGTKVITSTSTGSSGDFAAVLDKPLAAGDHQLVLRATKPDGQSLTSDEVATISVPKSDKSQLLAMVTKPGKASRIFTAPEAKAADTLPAPTSVPAPVSADKTGKPSSSGTAANPQVATANPSDKALAIPQGEAKPEVMVNAVEIEKDHIFVAGTAKPGAIVRAYADDAFIGESRTGADGHFVVDGPMPLTVGDHTIRVDVLGADGKVAVRASVPFTRPEGDQMTVAASSGASPSAAQGSLVSLDEGQLAKLKLDAAKAFSLLKGLFVDGAMPSDEKLAAARSSVRIALNSLIEFRPSADASEALKAAASASSSSAAKALDFLKSLPPGADLVMKSLQQLEAMMDNVTKPLAANPQAQATVQTAAGEPKTLQQAPLTESPDTVIIHRGDSLWRIARRVYGEGIRYTTIYIANEQKINNPDLILPGQVFGLPKDALPNAEEIHRQRMKGRS